MYFTLLMFAWVGLIALGCFALGRSRGLAQTYPKRRRASRRAYLGYPILFILMTVAATVVIVAGSWMPPQETARLTPVALWLATAAGVGLLFWLVLAIYVFVKDVQQCNDRD